MHDFIRSFLPCISPCTYLSKIIISSLISRDFSDAWPRRQVFFGKMYFLERRGTMSFPRAILMLAKHKHENENAREFLSRRKCRDTRDGNGMPRESGLRNHDEIIVVTTPKFL